VSASYIACTASTYGADSLTNRWPAPLTRMQPGRLRSARQKYGPPGSAIDGPHQASSISPTAAPRSSPARIPSPVFPAAPVVHCEPAGSRWYRRRISSLRSKPPVATSTPRRAAISTGSPSRVARTPHTRPSRTSRPVIGVSSQTGTPRAARPATLAPAQMARGWRGPRLSQRYSAWVMAAGDGR